MFLKRLFPDKLTKFRKEANRLIIIGNYTLLKVLRLRVKSYIEANKAKWNEEKCKEYQEFLDSLNEIL